jgi:hypothetical protein
MHQDADHRGSQLPQQQFVHHPICHPICLAGLVTR